MALIYSPGWRCPFQNQGTLGSFCFCFSTSVSIWASENREPGPDWCVCGDNSEALWALIPSPTGKNRPTVEDFSFPFAMETSRDWPPERRAFPLFLSLAGSLSIFLQIPLDVWISINRALMGINYSKGSEQAERRFFLNKWASSKKEKKKSSLGKVILNFYGTNHPQFMKLIDLRIQTNNKTKVHC